jgi:hypothetical protein
MRKNKAFPELFKPHVKIIENDIFGKFYNNSLKYQ